MRFWEITAKDLKLLFRDRRALAVLVVFPMIFITIIGLTTGKLLGWQNSNQLLRIAYVDALEYDKIETDFDSVELDEKERKRARNLITKIVNALQERKGLRMIPVETAEAAKAMATGDDTQGGESTNVALIFGPEFYQKVRELKNPDLLDIDEGVLKDGFDIIDLQLTSEEPDSSTHAIVKQLIDGTVYPILAIDVFARNGGFPKQAFNKQTSRLEAELDQPALERLPPTEESDGPGTGGVYDEIVPGLTVMFVFFLVNVMARSFLEERALGTLRRLRMAPVSAFSVMIGKTIPFYVLSLAQTLLLFLFGRLLFGMSWGTQPWLLIPIAMGTSLAATSLGLLIATVVRTDSQVSAYANTIVITFAGISGCFLPRAWLPDQMRALSLATPHAWSLIAYDNVLSKNTPDVGVVLQCFGMLVLFAILFFAIGTWRFRNLD